MKSVQRTLGALVLGLAGSTANAGIINVSPDSFYEDFSFDQSLVAPESGTFAGNLLSENNVFDYNNVTGGTIGNFPLGAGTTGQAYDDITSDHWLFGSGSYELVGQAGTFSPPIPNVTAGAAYNNNLLFANANGDLGVVDAITGNSQSYPNFFGVGIGGMDIDNDSGTPFLYAGDDSLPALFALDLSGDLFNGFTNNTLQQYNLEQVTGGTTGLTVDGQNVRWRSNDGIASYSNFPSIPAPGPLALGLAGLGIGAAGYRPTKKD